MRSSFDSDSCGILLIGRGIGLHTRCFGQEKKFIMKKSRESEFKNDAGDADCRTLSLMHAGRRSSALCQNCRRSISLLLLVPITQSIWNYSNHHPGRCWKLPSHRIGSIEKGTAGMSAIRNIPIGRKFKLAFGIVCLLCIALGLYSCLTYWDVSKKTRAMNEDFLPSIIHLTDMRGVLNVVRRQDLDLLVCQSADCIALHSSLRRKAIATFESKMKAYEPLIDAGEERNGFEATSTAYMRYRELSDRDSALDHVRLYAIDSRSQTVVREEILR